MFRKHRLQNWRGLTFCNVTHTPIIQEPEEGVERKEEKKPRVPGERLLMQLNKQRKKDKKRIDLSQIEKSIQDIINEF